MERATKERLTGAVILVAALAILVPEMLSGPGGDDVARETVAETGPPLTTYDLTIDSSAPASRQQQLSSVASQAQAIAEAVPPPVTAPPAPPADVVQEILPEPAATSSSSASSAPVVESAATPPAATQQSRAAAPPAKPAAAAGGWWVQLGSFSSAQNAQGLARKLRGQGFNIDVSVVRSGGKELHRVRAGPEKDRTAATALRSRLAAAGQQGTLIAP